MPEPKMNPSFRKEDQDMAQELKPTVIGPPAYASPDPATNAGRLVPVEEHPFDLDKDYGLGVAGAVSSNLGRQDAGEREGWTKEQWSNRAEELGVSKSGNKDEVRARVEEAEAAEGDDDDDNDED